MSIAKQMVDHANRIERAVDSIHKTHENQLVLQWEDHKAIVSKEEFFLEVLKGILPFASSANANAVFNNLLIRCELMQPSQVIRINSEIRKKKIMKTYEYMADNKLIFDEAEVFLGISRGQAISIYTWLNEMRVNGIDFTDEQQGLYSTMLYVMEKMGVI